MDSISDSCEKIKKFCEARDWDQFHDPKELSIGISTEANELLDLFRFKKEVDMEKMLEDPTIRGRISHELADIFFFLVRFSQRYQFDLIEALNEKMAVNEQKYPVEQARGSNKKYNELRD